MLNTKPIIISNKPIREFIIFDEVTSEGNLKNKGVLVATFEESEDSRDQSKLKALLAPTKGESTSNS